MAKFIKLHKLDNTGPVYVNTNHVVLVELLSNRQHAEFLRVHLEHHNTRLVDVKMVAKLHERLGLE